MIHEQSSNPVGETKIIVHASAPPTEYVRFKGVGTMAHFVRNTEPQVWLVGDEVRLLRPGQSPDPLPQQSSVFWFLPPAVDPLPPQLSELDVSQMKVVTAFGAKFEIAFDNDEIGFPSLRKPKILAAHPTTNKNPSLVIDQGDGTFYSLWLISQPWELKTPEDEERYKRIRLEWAKVLGGEVLPSLLPVPGMLNTTNGNEVRVVWRDLNFPLTLADFLAILRPPPPKAEPKHARRSRSQGQRSKQNGSKSRNSTS